MALATGEIHAQTACSASLAYTPFAVASVPTLTAWILLILALLVGVLAMRPMRKSNIAVRWVLLTAAAVSLAASGLAPHKALADNFNASDPAGGTLTFLMPGPHTVTNASGVPLWIASLSSDSGLNAPTTCQAGQALAPGASCQLTLGQCIGDPGTGGGGT